ncbi:MAG TPA: ABC transporter ATP-binding protein [Terriglobia bacterium]|nr:ABC transporter ATP-binding protein [Terriglobia bacterium]
MSDLKPKVTTTDGRPPIGKAKDLTIFVLLRPHWKALMGGFIAVMVGGMADILQPWPLKLVFDDVFKTKPLHGWLNRFIVSTMGQDPQAILEFAALAVVSIAIVGAVSSYAEKYLTTSVGQWVMHDLRRTLYSHIQRLSLAYHDQKRTGDLISTATSDIDAIQSFIASGLLGVFEDSFTLVGMVGVMFYVNWRFTLIALSVAPVLAVVVYTYTRRIKKASRAVRKKEGEIVSVIQEVFSSIRVVKAFAREDYEQHRLEEQSLENVEIALSARKLKARLSPLVDVIVAVGTGLVLWFGSRMVMSGDLSPGSLILFFLYLAKMYKPMQDLSKMTDTFSKATVGYERIREVLETESRVRDLPRASKAPRFKGKIEFENVTFGYTRDNLVLKNVSLTIEPGQLAAIIGPTGEGKSTIIGLIPRFYDPISGMVKIDGTDVKRWRQQSLRRQISFVLQDTLLFHAPIWQNIAYGKPEATRKQIMEAAEFADAREFIEEMPERYDTLVGERGVTLSGGQRQRIAIARAVIRNSPILILDEPTTGLDPESELLVVGALERLMKGKTSIVITHHLATIRNANVIFVVKDSTLVERGTHEELVAAGGVYAELSGIQFGPEPQKPTGEISEAKP